MQPNPGNLNPAQVRPVLDAMAANTGQIQDGLAGAAQAALAGVNKNTKSMKRTLNGRKSAAVQFVQNTSGAIAQQLGTSAQQLLLDSQRQSRTLQNAAVGVGSTLVPVAGSAADTLRAAAGPSTAPDSQPAPVLYYTAVNCNTNPPTYTNISSTTDISTLTDNDYVLIDMILRPAGEATAFIEQQQRAGNPFCFNQQRPPSAPAAPSPPITKPAAVPTTYGVYYNCNTAQFTPVMVAFDDPGDQSVYLQQGWRLYQGGFTSLELAQAFIESTVANLLPANQWLGQYSQLGAPTVLGRYLCQSPPTTTPTPTVSPPAPIPPPVPAQPPPTTPSPGQPCPPCQAPAPPPPPPTACATTLPDLVCSVAPGGNLPAVGSAEWCQCVKAMIDWFSALGNAFKTQVEGVIGTGGSGGVLGAMADVFNNTLGPISPLFNIANLKTLINTEGGDISCAYDLLVNAVSDLSTRVGAPLLGLTLARTLLRCLRRLRAGWDLGPVIFLELEIDLRPIEQLLDYCEHYVFPWELPAVGEAIDCILQTTAPIDQAHCWMLSQGANPDVWDAVIDARREKLQTAELIQYSRRIGETDDQTVQRLESQGWYRPEEANARVALYDELPTITDHLHFLQRNVFDDNYVTQYQLLDGFAERFWPKFGADLHSLGMRQEYAELHYAAHWIIPEVGQLQEMMFRLRPGRVDPAIEFTPDDFNNLLAEQDIAPWYRPRLQKIAYRTIPLRQLNQAAQQGRYDRDEIIARWQDLGFNAADATTLADTLLVTAARQSASAAHGFTASVVSELAQYGLISEDMANEKLNPQGFDATKVKELFKVSRLKQALSEVKRHEEGTVNAYANLALAAYEDGTVSQDNARIALVNAGYTPAAADLAIKTADLKVKRATVNAAVATTHKAFRYGAVNASGAGMALLAAGVTNDMTTTYVARWQLEMSVPRISASSAAILRWTRKGIMSVTNARMRLINLGWNPGDAELQLAEIEQAIRQAQSLATQRRAKALAAAQKAAQQAIRAAQKESCKVYSPTKMIRWYKLRIIDQEVFRARLQQCGYNDAEIQGLYEEAEVARAAADKKAEKSGAIGVEYTGPGAVPGGPPP